MIDPVETTRPNPLTRNTDTTKSGQSIARKEEPAQREAREPSESKPAVEAEGKNELAEA